MSNIKELILAAIQEAQTGYTYRKAIFEDKNLQGSHEFLFFIKPEITLQSETIETEGILEMILSKIEEFGLRIKNTLLLPSAYLEKYAIIAQHYGVINAIARDAEANLSNHAKSHFEALYQQKFNEASIYGGLEFLRQYPDFNATSLDRLWQNSPTEKLGGGAYAQALSIDGAPVFLVNGFHPRQLEHFTLAGRSIVAFTLCGDLDWSTARNAFIGKTQPNDAEAGSIRRTLLEQKDKLGLQAVNSSWNGVHLSAGPVEGLIELIRYNSDFESGTALSSSEFAFGQELAKHFNEEQLSMILNNANVSYRGNTESIFDITEEKNAGEAIAILKEVF